MNSNVYWRILRKVVMLGKSRTGSYYYGKLICLRYRVGEQYPYLIDIYKCPVDLGAGLCDVPVRLYFDNIDDRRVVHIEPCHDLDEDGEPILDF